MRGEKTSPLHIRIYTEYTTVVSHASDLSNSNLPMPARYMKMYGRFWDVVSLLIFGATAITTLTAEVLTWREYVVSGLCILSDPVLRYSDLPGSRKMMQLINKHSGYREKLQNWVLQF